MKIIVYAQLTRTRNPTGVGKHIINMTRQLTQMPDTDVELFCAREQLDRDGHVDDGCPLAGIPARSYPWPQKYMELAWMVGGWPDAQRWVGEADWVYSPSEVRIPLQRTKLAVTSHCVNWLEPELPWYNDPDVARARLAWRVRMRRMRQHADVVLTVSEFARGRLIELVGVDPARTFVVGNGVEEDYFRVAHEPRRTSARPYLLVIGGLTRRKNGPIIISTAEILKRRRAEIAIQVVGGGEPALEAEAARVGNIHQLGYRNVNVLPRLVRDATALLFPSRYETFGIPAVEAMAAGTPAIVSDWGALPEVVGDAGIVVPGGDPTIIADWVLRLLDDANLHRQYEARGRERAQAFTWKACANRLQNALAAA